MNNANDPTVRLLVAWFCDPTTTDHEELRRRLEAMPNHLFQPFAAGARTHLQDEGTEQEPHTRLPMRAAQPDDHTVVVAAFPAGALAEQKRALLTDECRRRGALADEPYSDG